MRRRQFLGLTATGAAALLVNPAKASVLLQTPLLPLFPLEIVLLPHTVLPLHIFEERYKDMVQDCLESRSEFGLVLVTDQTMRRTGCTASIDRVLQRFPDGRMNILVRGQRRFEFSELNEGKSYFRGAPQFIEDSPEDAPDEEICKSALALSNRLMELARSDNQAFQDPPPTIADSQMSYRLVAGLPAELDWKQALLEERSERARLTLVIEYFRQMIQRFEPGSRQII